ncbi:MAG: 2-oxo acid dehydrogenase subunit E2, partial [Eubacterium sp.]|nr:2-oxo acid dehydrogenase subunit E2 [Eubacterium sp.]
EAAPAAVSAVKGEGIAATPMAKRLAKEAGLSLADIQPTGKHGEIVAADVEAAQNAKPKASMLAARIAADQNIDLGAVAGSGFGGKIMKRDLQTKEEAALDGIMAEIEELIERRKMNGMRKAIARRMSASHTEIPVVTQNYKIDVTELLELRSQVNAGLEKEEKISINDFIIKALGKALKKFERFRMQLDGDEYVLYNSCNVSVAVGMEDGLVVPVIRNADKKSLQEISAEAKALAKKGREGKLTQDELKGGQITVSNIGMYGVHSFTPIINQPEAAILGACGVEDELALIDGQVSVRKKMMICLTYDHRIVNGTEVCEFEMYLKDLMEHPLRIII